MTASNEEGGSLVFFDTTELIKRRKLGTPGHAPSSERLHKWCHLIFWGWLGWELVNRHVKLNFGEPEGGLMKFE